MLEPIELIKIGLDIQIILLGFSSLCFVAVLAIEQLKRTFSVNSEATE